MRFVGSRALVLFLVIAGPLPVAADDGERLARPALADAARLMDVILGAVEQVPAQVLLMDVGRERARLQVEVEERSALEAVRSALEGSALPRMAALDRGRPVEFSEFVTAAGRWRGDLVVPFPSGHGSKAPERAATHISMAEMSAFADQAQLRIIHAWAEHAHVDSRNGIQTVTQRLQFERADNGAGTLTLQPLRSLFALLRGSRTYRVTAVQWHRESATAGGDTKGDRIANLCIEVAVWTPPVDGTADVPAPGALAQSILRGSAADLVSAAALLDSYSQDARVLLLREIHGQARVWGVLANRHTRGASLKAARLEEALQAILGPHDVPWDLSERVRAESAQGVEVALETDGVTLASALAQITEPYGMGFVVRDGTVFVLMAAEGEPIQWSVR